MSPRTIVLASGSRHRARLLTDGGWDVRIDPPEVDERALDPLFETMGPEAFATSLAVKKAEAVAPRHPDAVLIAADQVGVLTTATGPVQLTKQSDEAGAVAQLVSMAGTTHELVNAVVVLDTSTGRSVDGIDRQRVTMRLFDAGEARQYVRRFAPYDSGGSYRLEDQERMAPLEGFVVSVEGEDDSGVLGLPLPLLGRLLDRLGVAHG